MRSATQHLLDRLPDGEPHACTKLAAEIEVTPNAIQQAASRLRRSGVPIVSEGGAYRMVDARRCLLCDRRISRHARRQLCCLHEREPIRRHNQQMALTV